MRLSHYFVNIANENTENDKLNQKYFGNVGMGVVPGIEISNHRFPKASDNGTYYGFYLEAVPGYLLAKVYGSYKAGEHVEWAYRDDGTNRIMLFGYGATALDNYDNKIDLKINKEIFNVEKYPLRHKI